MCPEKAKVFFVEDNQAALDTCTEFLENAGHTVVETATTLREALEKIPGLDKKGVNVAVVDGNLNEYSASGYDGETVARQIKTQHPDIKVIGHSLTKFISAADINCPKIRGADKLAEAVTNA